MFLRMEKNLAYQAGIEHGRNLEYQRQQNESVHREYGKSTAMVPAVLKARTPTRQAAHQVA